MRDSVSRMVVAATLAAAGLAACSDTTPWAYPTEPETAQHAASVRVEPLPRPAAAPPAYTAPRVIATAPAPVSPPPTVTYAPPRTVPASPPTPVVTAPPRVAGAAPPVTVAAALRAPPTPHRRRR
ncbi:hypothetical protein [Inquilinus sp. Marseille-Q2685]|uniref:hypothetical protein n=1 Tax=Inquilinus sp. Marseille-Q2685 TaxID=2866581 RepID=UPI001CE3FEC1|nr:hypothetical protein [Inquilinus sp. Marseille-Q2685]